jgi:hypothetical protein
MRIYIYSFICFVAFAICVAWTPSEGRTSTSCEPQLGSCKVCDSIEGLYRADALALAYREAQDSTLPYYHNIILQESRIAVYEKCLALLYNNLEDSMLFGLRTYHPPEAADTSEFYKVTLQIQGASKNKWRTRSGRCGYKNFDNILVEVGMIPVGEVKKQGDYMYADYITKHPLNKVALQRRFAAQPKITVRVERYLSPLHYVGMLDYKNVREVTSHDSTYVLLQYPFGPGMPPELPYPTATDIYHVKGCTLSYVRTTTRRN